MQKEKPLWERLYFDEAYVEIARLIGYHGATYRDMMRMLEPLERKIGKQRVQSATYHIVTFEGQMTSIRHLSPMSNYGPTFDASAGNCLVRRRKAEKRSAGSLQRQ